MAVQTEMPPSMRHPSARSTRSGGLAAALGRLGEVDWGAGLMRGRDNLEVRDIAASAVYGPPNKNGPGLCGTVSPLEGRCPREKDSLQFGSLPSVRGALALPFGFRLVGPPTSSPRWDIKQAATPC